MSKQVEISIVKKIWHLLTPKERRGTVVLLMLICIGVFLETLGVGLVIPAIALLTQADLGEKYSALARFFEMLGNPDQKTLVVGGLLCLVAVYLVKGVFLANLFWRQTRFAYGMQVRLSQLLFTIYLRQPYTFHLQRNTTQLIHNVSSEVGNLIAHAILPGMILITEIMVLFGMCAMLIAFEPLGTFMVIVILGAAAWGFQRVTGRHISRWGKARHHHEVLRAQHLQQGLSGIKDVKILGREAEFLKQFDIHNTKSAHVAIMQGTLQQLPRLWLELLAVSALAILVISMLAQNRPLESILPMLGLFAAAAFRLMPSVNRVINAIQSIRYGSHGIDTLFAEIGLAHHVFDSERGTVPLRDSLELRHVSYSYPNASKQALSDISIQIQRGESIGFIGPSGSGKSTLVDVLLGLLTPDSGEIVLDGENIQENLRNWQNQIGYVPQTIYLTDDTLRNNVAFGLAEKEINDDALLSAIRAAQLEDFVASLPDGLATMVGERGVRLSGGQRQRIGIARALYHDPDILVLDEATSSLDNETEEGVMNAVKALHGQKTILIVAHRLSTVEHCDRLYRFGAGKIVGQGDASAILFSEHPN